MSSVSSIGSQVSPSASRATTWARSDPAAGGAPERVRDGPATTATAPATGPSNPGALAPRLVEELARRLQEHSPQHTVTLQAGSSPAEPIIEVRDRQTHELIRQIPPEEMLALRDQMQEVLKDKGLLVDTIS